MFHPVVRVLRQHLFFPLARACVSYLEGFYVVGDREIALQHRKRLTILTRVWLVERWTGPCFRLDVTFQQNAIRYFYHRQDGQLEGDVITLDPAHFVNAIQHYVHGKPHGCHIRTSCNCDNVFSMVTQYRDGKKGPTIRSRQHRGKRDVDPYAFVEKFESSLNIQHNIARPNAIQWPNTCVADGMDHLVQSSIHELNEEACEWNDVVSRKKWKFCALHPELDTFKRLRFQYGYRVYYF